MLTQVTLATGPPTPVSQEPVATGTPVVLTFAAVGYVAAAAAVTLWSFLGGNRLPGGRGAAAPLLTPVEASGTLAGAAVGVYTGGLVWPEVGVVLPVNWTVPVPLLGGLQLYQRGTTAGLVSLSVAVVALLLLAATLLAGVSLTREAREGQFDTKWTGPVVGVAGVAIALAVGAIGTRPIVLFLALLVLVAGSVLVVVTVTDPSPAGSLGATTVALGVAIAAVLGYVSGLVLVAATGLLWLNLRVGIGSVPSWTTLGTGE